MFYNRSMIVCTYAVEGDVKSRRPSNFKQMDDVVELGGVSVWEGCGVWVGKLAVRQVCVWPVQ